MKKVILTTNEHAIQEVHARANTAKKLLNQFIQKAEAEAKVKFSNEDKIQLKDNGSDFLTEYFKSKFPIPGATDEFNLQALNVDLNGLLKHNRKDLWQAYNFKLTKNGFELEGEPEQLKDCYTYVETEKQAEALKLAEDLSKLLNKASDLGYLSNKYLPKVKDLGDLLWTENAKEEGENGVINYKTVVTPNKGRISRLMK